MRNERDKLREITKTAYHIDVSIKEAGKKCLGISLWEDPGMVSDFLNRLRTV